MEETTSPGILFIQGEPPKRGSFFAQRGRVGVSVIYSVQFQSLYLYFAQGGAAESGIIRSINVRRKNNEGTI